MSGGPSTTDGAAPDAATLEAGARAWITDDPDPAGSRAAFTMETSASA